MKKLLLASAVTLSFNLCAAGGTSEPIGSNVTPATQSVLFQNVNIFNGTDNRLYRGHDVLIQGNKIAEISESDITAPIGAQIIKGEGRTLMPGMIDGHAHMMINAHFDRVERSMDEVELGVRGVKVAENMLLDGFTTVRDMGGPAMGLKRQIDEGTVIGPRIYASGAFISQTSGHGDFRDMNDGFNDNDVSNFGRMHIGKVADGKDEVLRAVRQNLRNGASQIKIMAGGGGSSKYDPIHTSQFTRGEICAAVDAASDWGTYVAAHVFNDKSVNRLLDCGVKSFEHGFFISDDTMERISEAGGYVVPQMWGLSPELANNPLMPKEKLPMVAELQKAYGDFGERLLENDVKVVFATDYVGEFSDARKAMRYELYWRTQAFGSNFEVLKQLTSNAGELMAETGPLNPYPGQLGVVEKGALADLILVDGDPLKDISVLGGEKVWFAQPDPATNPIDTINIIMKDGQIYKNLDQ